MTLFLDLTCGLFGFTQLKITFNWHDNFNNRVNCSCFLIMRVYTIFIFGSSENYIFLLISYSTLKFTPFFFCFVLFISLSFFNNGWKKKNWTDEKFTDGRSEYYLMYVEDLNLFKFLINFKLPNIKRLLTSDLLIWWKIYRRAVWVLSDACRGLILKLLITFTS